MGVIPPKPGNAEQVTEIEELILLFRHQTLDSPKLTLLHKTFKAARLAMADKVVLNRTNTDLLAANTQKKRRPQRTGIAYDGQAPRVLNLENDKKRKQLAENKEKDKEAKQLAQKEKQDDRYFLQVSKNLMRLGPDLIFGLNPLISSKNTENFSSSTRNKKHNNQVLTNAFQDLLCIEPDVFEELVLDGLVSNTLIQNKEKCIPKRKNTAGSVQIRLEVGEEEKEEKVSEVRVSTRSRIICNTRKM